MALHRVIILLTALHCLTCDEHNGPLNFRIIGGQETIPHSKPWMVFISSNSPEDTRFCGGFLVSEDFVMTAAHCAGRNMKVSLGLHSLEERNDQNTFSVLNSFRNNNFDSETHESDIMLLQLDHQAHLNDAVQIIALPKKNKRVPLGTVCNVAGWGQTNRGTDTSSQVLMEVNVTVVGNKECHSVLKVPISSAMMCAGQPGTTGDAAQGDSGSPLVCDGVATGIVSFGYQNPPGVYTHIPSFLPWIRKILSFSKYTPKGLIHLP